MISVPILPLFPHILVDSGVEVRHSFFSREGFAAMMNAEVDTSPQRRLGPNSASLAVSDHVKFNLKSTSGVGVSP